jgi:hypothetical protein
LVSASFVGFVFPLNYCHYSLNLTGGRGKTVCPSVGHCHRLPRLHQQWH